MSFSPEHGKTPAGGIGIPKDMQQGRVLSLYLLVSQVWWDVSSVSL